MNINEKDHKDLLESWRKKAKEIKTTDELVAFIKSLETGYCHDYGTIVHAIAAGMMATLSVMDKGPQGGITGFQASCLMHELIPQLSMIEPPYRIMQYKDLLYPQYRGKFDKTISAEIWARLQDEAGRMLEENSKYAHGDVLGHWQDIVDGHVPFGFTVKEENS